MHHTVKITSDEIRGAWDALQSGRNPVRGQTALTGYAEGRWVGSTVDTFVGCSGAQMNDRLRFGYVPKNAPEIDATTGADFNLPAMELSEDGSLVLDAALAGEDFYRVQWLDTPSKRGLTIRANVAFAAGTDVEAQISRYLDWLLAVVDAAQTQGVPVDLELAIRTKGSLQHRPADVLEVVIPVFRAGETMDVAAWRAFLSPGSFRSLGFLSMGLAADKLGHTLVGTLGYPTGKDWTADFDAEGGTLTLDVPSWPDGEFPADAMTAKAQLAFDAL